MTQHIREPINALTHLFGAGLFIILTIVMYIKIYFTGVTAARVISATVFGLSLIALYATSGWYHTIIASPKRLMLWKKLDHTMIFVLIAGTYTPYCLLGLPQPLGYILLSVVWGIAIIGSLMMIFWISMPRWLNTALYVLMGWVALSCVIEMYHSLAFGAFFLLVLGGVFYTIGAIIYGIKKPNISEAFGFHELFHIFCLLGSLSQFLSVYLYLL